MDTVIVFGATGFLGRTLIEALAARGLQAVAVSRRGAEVPGAARSVAMAEIDSLAFDPAATAVFHVAAMLYAPARFELRSETVERDFIFAGDVAVAWYRQALADVATNA